VFRYQFQHNASGQRQTAGVYCLSLGGLEASQNPSDELMSRFQSHEPPVKKVSQCTRSPVYGVQDKQTEKQGLIFRIDRISWVDDTEVEVEGGYYESGLSASGDFYRVVRKLGRWRVKEDRMLWIAQIRASPASRAWDR
jgi:hypothetical protein